MGKLINRIPGSRLLISSLPGSALRTHVESLGKPRESTCVIKALPGKLDIKRHSPSILYISISILSRVRSPLNQKAILLLLLLSTINWESNEECWRIVESNLLLSQAYLNLTFIQLCYYVVSENKYIPNRMIEVHGRRKFWEIQISKSKLYDRCAWV